MRKKQRMQQTQPNETAIHPIGREKFICVQNYVGDLPSDEPVDWFAQSDEDEPSEFLIGTTDIDPRRER